MSSLRKRKPRKATPTSSKDSSSKASPPRARFYTEDTAHELMDGHFFIKMVDDDSWLFVDDELYQPQEGAGVGWALNLFYRGYKVVVRYAADVGKHDAHRMLFSCEPGKATGHVRLRARASSTLLFMLGVKRPMTLVAWDREVLGGDLEDFKLVWLSHLDGEGRVLLRSRMADGYLQWTGQKFVHAAARDSATRFLLVACQA